MLSLIKKLKARLKLILQTLSYYVPFSSTIVVAIRQGTVHRLAQHISEHYGNDWVCLGHELGLTFEEVNKFERDYQSVVERIYHMIQAWLEKKGEAVGTKRTLIAMLHGLHWQDSADVLASKWQL